MPARIAGTELNYDVRGEGPTLLFLHAFPLDLTMWDAPAEALAPLYRVVRFDCRGFGRTPPGDGLLTMERIADDAVALLDHLGLSRAVVVGCSMGGYAAFALARRQAERLRGLVLVDTRAEADTAEARQQRARLAERVRLEGAAVARDVFLPRLLGATTQRERPELVARVEQQILATSPRGIVDGLMGLSARADSTATLAGVRVPTLVVCGEEDVLTPPADARRLAQAIAGSRLEILPGSGHLPSLEVPQDFTRVLRAFLDGLE
jgi:pimeloyl-ACP methyl ester carboxylesterase